MEIKTLSGVSTAEIAQAFNEAFSDYLVPISLTESDMEEKMRAENTRRDYSAGVFSGGKLAGFILIGIDHGVAYNGGTGVIPSLRGQHLTRRMYDFLFGILAQAGIQNHLLEVITENKKALSVYEKIGFRTARVLGCFKGKIIETPKSPAIIKKIAIEDYSHFWDFKPSYQNSSTAILHSRNQHQALAAVVGEVIVGYIIFTENGRVKQVAVDKPFRQKGIGRQLFAEVQKSVGDKIISLTNVEDCGGSIDFLKKIGLEPTVEQYEMIYCDTTMVTQSEQTLNQVQSSKPQPN